MDIWRSGIVRAPLDAVLEAGSIDGFAIHWLPDAHGSFRFVADPFAIEHEGQFHCFVEALDYRDRHGRIEVSVHDRDLNLVERATCLAEPWHLSYPFVFRDGGGYYMLPEAHRSGALTLYRATEFPFRWKPHVVIDLPSNPVDATPIRYANRWWLFYAEAGSVEDELHLAYADRLEGPWQAHRSNPVRRGNDGSRPGGTPMIIDGKLVLPVQDCSTTYGGAIRALSFHELTTERCSFRLGPPIVAPSTFAPFDAGLHTLSACGEFTLFDVKRIDRSMMGKGIGWLGKARRAVARYRQRSR